MTERENLPDIPMVDSGTYNEDEIQLVPVEDGGSGTDGEPEEQPEGEPDDGTGGGGGDDEGPEEGEPDDGEPKEPKGGGDGPPPPPPPPFPPRNPPPPSDPPPIPPPPPPMVTYTMPTDELKIRLNRLLRTEFKLKSLLKNLKNIDDANNVGDEIVKRQTDYYLWWTYAELYLRGEDNNSVKRFFDFARKYDKHLRFLNETLDTNYKIKQNETIKIRLDYNSNYDNSASLDLEIIGFQGVEIFVKSLNDVNYFLENLPDIIEITNYEVDTENERDLTWKKTQLIKSFLDLVEKYIINDNDYFKFFSFAIVANPKFFGEKWYQQHINYLFDTIGLSKLTFLGQDGYLFYGSQYNFEEACSKLRFNSVDYNREQEIYWNVIRKKTVDVDELIIYKITKGKDKKTTFEKIIDTIDTQIFFILMSTFNVQTFYYYIAETLDTDEHAKILVEKLEKLFNLQMDEQFEFMSNINLESYLRYGV